MSQTTGPMRPERPRERHNNSCQPCRIQHRCGTQDRDSLTDGKCSDCRRLGAACIYEASLMSDGATTTVPTGVTVCPFEGHPASAHLQHDMNSASALNRERPAQSLPPPPDVNGDDHEHLSWMLQPVDSPSGSEEGLPSLKPNRKNSMLPVAVDTHHFSRAQVPTQWSPLLHAAPAVASTALIHRPPWMHRLPQVDAPCDLTGRVIQRRGLMNQGSFAKIYRGDFEGNIVCIKALKEICISSRKDIAKFCKRLLREVKAWATLRHPNVVVFYGWMLEYSEEDNTICAKLISAWCEGGNVLEHLELVVDVSEGLMYLHSWDVVHGDIKPENIVVNAEGMAMLCDFGLSSILSDLSMHEEGSSIISTARFTSPEILSCHVKKPNKKSDVWAFGCASGQVLFNIRPYVTLPGILDVHHAVVNGEPPFTWNEPDKFFATIERCLKWDPEERPSIEEVTQNFRSLYHH
ncbi:kinase-like domain-containing protein [Cantharellus anzutake]|uniref:kinase-like domain-containing protein n=1 Tax=Cantharellus anzutake TaxID=1750568 RepID=UPI0019041E28|nr:kinase-like domain-containing protein [Cantharellus anzutake]KAF8333060.1 kinase-like domain-containing protein [Cantharellus anzutake]